MDFPKFIHDITNTINMEYPKLSSQNRELLATHFRMAFQDAHFIRVRNREGLIPIELPNYWTLEEQCFLMKTKELLQNNPITPKLAILIQTIFGRNKYNVTFDPTFPQDVTTLVSEITQPEGNDKIPHFKYFQVDEYGTIYYNPSLIYKYIEDLIAMPNIVCNFIKYSKDPQDPTKIIKTPSTTSNIKEINQKIGTPLKKKRITFHCAYSIPINIEIFPCGQNDSWYRINSGAFKMAFGRDLSNGKGIKYPWINTLDGTCPYTLSDQCGDPPVDWVPAEDDYVTRALDQDILKFECPQFHPDTYKDHAYASLNDNQDQDGLNLKLFWINEKSQTISDSDIQKILYYSAQKQCFIVQCSKNADCKGECKRCVVKNNGPLKDLGVFYSEKGWGVVALKDIPSGTYITDYAGEIIPQAYSDQKLDLGFQFELGLDSTDAGVKADNKTNIGRFINESCYTPEDKQTDFQQPNAISLFIISLNKTIFRVGYFATRKIYAGEEISVSYGGKYAGYDKCLCNICLRKSNSENV